MEPRLIAASRLAGLALVLLLGPASARAGFVINVQSVTAAAGSTNDTLNVSLTYTGAGPVTIGGFAFEIKAGTGVTFTSVDLATTPAYIFAGHSAFGPDLSNPPPNLPGNILAAEDNYNVNNQGISLASGGTVGLGLVHFNVSALATGPISIQLVGFPTTNISNATGGDLTQGVGTTYNGGTVTAAPASVPEPSSLAMTALALGLVASGRRRMLRRRPG